ncbi:MAG: transposase [Candidatus Saccharimonas sp.]|nr:transposase [Planctomycetaceae bacterium]
MEQRARDGAPLDELVRIAVQFCRLAEERHPRRGPGRPPVIPDWVLAVMVMVAVMLRKKAKSAQYAWWNNRRGDFARWFVGQKFPGRSTFFDRYHRIHGLFQHALVLQGQEAVRKGWADAQCVAIDKSLIGGRGRPWSRRDRRQNKRRKRVDHDTTWGYSKHHGWVQGYSTEVIVTAGPDRINWPLIASADTASRSEQKSCLDKFVRLPKETRFVLADSGYDSNAVGEAVEWDAHGQRTGCRFLCPEVNRPNNGKSRQPHPRQSRERQHHRRLREARRTYFLSPHGRRLYARRKVSVEPFHSHWKHLFDLDHRVWHWGLANNRTMLVAAIFAYQTLLTYNHRHRLRSTCIKAILDAL